jgi:hypothetical protein
MWAPPFDKTQTVVEYVGEAGEEFDLDDAIKSNVFKIIELKTNYAVVAFSLQYTLKKSQYFQSDLLISPSVLKLPLDVEIEFSYMWGTKGITKKIKYTGIKSGDVSNDEKPVLTEDNVNAESYDEYADVDNSSDDE